jgi:hypothetical protein
MNQPLSVELVLALTESWGDTDMATILGVMRNIPNFHRLVHNQSHLFFFAAIMKLAIRLLSSLTGILWISRFSFLYFRKFSTFFYVMLDILYESNLLSGSSPEALLNSKWFNNSANFGLGGVQEHYQLRYIKVMLFVTTLHIRFSQLTLNKCISITLYRNINFLREMNIE